MTVTVEDIEKRQEELRVKAEKAKEAGDELTYILLKYLERSYESDKCFRNSDELMEVYRSVTKNGVIEVNGMKWPINTLIITTPNSEA